MLFRSARLRRAFRLCLGRDARTSEVDRLLRVMTMQRAQLAADEAAKLVPDRFAGNLDRREFAVWVTVGRVLLNLDEFITRE